MLYQDALDQAFRLSPGITPRIAESAIFLVTLSLGLGYLTHNERLLGIILSLDVGSMASFKVYTDYSDFRDLVFASVSLFIAFVNILAIFLMSKVNPGSHLRAAAACLTLLCVVGVGLSLLKVRGDFYDPFDLLLASISIVTDFFAARRLLHIGFMK